MKKALSIVLSVAMLVTCIFSMAVLPASAAVGYDFLWEATPMASDGLSYEMTEDALVITATAAGQELALVLDGEGYEANLNDFPYYELTIDSDIPFDVALYDPNNSKWMFAAGDFCYNFEPNNGAANPIPAGVHDVKFSLTGAYTWTGAPLPANAAVKSITFIAKQAGTMVVSKCAMTDGISDVQIFPENDFWELYENWNCYESLVSDNADEWIPSDPANSGDSEAIVSYDEENWVMNFGNTNGGWPSASIEVNKKVDYYTTAIDLSLSVLPGAQTTLYVFFGDATPDDFEGAGKAYGTIIQDVTAGNYWGTVMLSDILPEDSEVIDENGMVNISYVKLFATSNGTAMDPAVVVNYIDLCYYEENPAPEGLGDIDLDDDVDTYDALVCFNAAFETITLNEEEYDRADFDRDFYVTIWDALGIFFTAAGLM